MKYLLLLSFVVFILMTTLLVLDLSLISDGAPLDGIGFAALFLLPPIGILLAYHANQKTAGVMYQKALIILHLLAFLFMPLYWFFGTLLFGP